MRFRRPFRRTRKGDFNLTIPPDERDVLRQLPDQLRELLTTDDPSLRRVFPPAYPDDEELEAEYRKFMADDLLDRHNGALEIMRDTIDQDRLDEDQMVAWLGALNDLRLVLGTRLDVTEDLDPTALADDDPRHPAFALYHYLTWLQGELIEALSSR